MEIWKDIKESNGKYQVSNLGRVLHKLKNRAVTPWVNKRGYCMISFANEDKKVVHRAVHRLVLITFASNPESKPEVNHKDGVKTNNNLINLEWATKSENSIHAIVNKLRPSGDTMPNAKLNSDIVRCIRDLYKTSTFGYRKIVNFIQAEYQICVSRTLVKKVIKRELWKEI